MRKPVVCSLEVDSACADIFGIFPKLFENFLESGNSVCSATTVRKTALSFQHDSSLIKKSRYGRPSNLSKQRLSAKSLEGLLAAKHTSFCFLVFINVCLLRTTVQIQGDE